MVMAVVQQCEVNTIRSSVISAALLVLVTLLCVDLPCKPFQDYGVFFIAMIAITQSNHVLSQSVCDWNGPTGLCFVAIMQSYNLGNHSEVKAVFHYRNTIIAIIVKWWLHFVTNVQSEQS